MVTFLRAGVFGLLLIWFWGYALAGEFGDALAAYRRGHYSTAIAIWTPMAEAGNAEAQSALGYLYMEGRVPRDTVKEGLI